MATLSRVDSRSRRYFDFDSNAEERAYDSTRRDHRPDLSWRCSFGHGRHERTYGAAGHDDRFRRRHRRSPRQPPRVVVVIIDARSRLLADDAGRGGYVLHGLPHHEELLRRARGLHKKQELPRRGGRDRAGRPISVRDAGAGQGQVRRRRPVGRQEHGNCRGCFSFSELAISELGIGACIRSTLSLL